MDHTFTRFPTSHFRQRYLPGSAGALLPGRGHLKCAKGTWGSMAIRKRDPMKQVSAGGNVNQLSRCGSCKKPPPRVYTAAELDLLDKIPPSGNVMRVVGTENMADPRINTENIGDGPNPNTAAQMFPMDQDPLLGNPADRRPEMYAQQLGWPQNPDRTRLTPRQRFALQMLQKQ